MPSADDINVQIAGPGDVERVARVRARCYRPGYFREPDMVAATRADRADFAAGDVLVTTRGNRDVATTTCLRGELNVRGSLLPCQGIAWVGTTHDARRAGGVAGKTMRRALDLGRERGETFSALMPFRASYYERFGYGLCERRAIWKVPPQLLPGGDASSIRLVEPDDDDTLAGLAEARRRQIAHARLGHGDVWFPHAPSGGVRHWRDYYRDKGYLFADHADDGSVRGWLGCVPIDLDGRVGLDVQHTIFDTPSGFMRQLAFLGTLQDQYGVVQFAAPIDRPLHLLLGETQLPHRRVEHVHATCEVHARNQVRVLDHERALSEPAWPEPQRKGGCVVRVRECEGTGTTLRLNIEGGRCEAKLTDASPDFECDDKVWAPILLGELRAPWAATHGLATAHDSAAAALLDDLSRGPVPFCREYF